MSDDEMDGLDHLDAGTEGRLGKAAIARYVAECVKAGKVAKAVHKTRVDSSEVLLEDDKGGLLARYLWVYDAVVGMARLK